LLSKRRTHGKIPKFLLLDASPKAKVLAKIKTLKRPKKLIKLAISFKGLARLALMTAINLIRA